MSTTTAVSSLPIASLKRLTTRNCHTSAYIMGAKALGLDELVTKLQAVAAVEKVEGYLPHEQSQIRYGLYTEMVNHAKGVLSPADFKKFYGCF